MGLVATRLLCRWDSPGKNTGVGRHALLQDLRHPRIEHAFHVSCIGRQVLYHLRHLGSLSINVYIFIFNDYTLVSYFTTTLLLTIVCVNIEWL